MRLLRFILLFTHLTVLFLIIAVGINRLVSPSVFSYFNFLSLGFPFLVMLYLVLTLFWALMLKKRTFLFVAGILLFITPLRRWINFSGENQEKGNFRILTFNSKVNSEQKILDYGEFLNHLDYDVLVLQEASNLAAVKQNNFPHKTSHGLNFLFSRHKILKSEAIFGLDGDDSGNAFYADIDVNGKTVRIINVYLNPFFLKKEMVKPTGEINENDRKFRTLVSKMRPNFRKHQQEIDKIKPFIENSPYPVIVAGDLNAVPNSYEYYGISEHLADTFLETGRGLGTTFHDYKFPIRIDYIFVSKEIRPVSFHIDRNVKLSDHYPSIAELKLPN